MYKTCSICNIQKELSEFHLLKNGINGKHSQCKECRKKYNQGIKIMKNNDKQMKCDKCNIIKPLSEFYKDSSKSTGSRNECIDCFTTKIEPRKYFEKLIKKLKNQDEVPVELLLNLHSDQLGKCNYTNQDFVFSTVKNIFNPVIDLKDPTKGYIRTNIQLLCSNVAELKKGLNENDFLNLIFTISEKIKK